MRKLDHKEWAGPAVNMEKQQEPWLSIFLVIAIFGGGQYSLSFFSVWLERFFRQMIVDAFSEIVVGDGKVQQTPRRTVAVQGTGPTKNSCNSCPGSLQVLRQVPEM
ncbi:Uncharacterized protein Rs2_37528 [Raphanus sativus]|nr:Uncharacterized protein Rs2_37528 [Raphanus sativus]